MAMSKRIPNEQDMELIQPIKSKIDALKIKHSKFFRPDNKELMMKLEPLLSDLLILKSKSGKYMLSYSYIAEEILDWKTSLLISRIVRNSNIRRNDKRKSPVSVKIKYEIQRIDAEVNKYSNRTKYRISRKYKERMTPVVTTLLKIKLGSTNKYAYRYDDIAEITGLNKFEIAKIAKHNGLSRNNIKGVKVWEIK